MHLRLPLPCVCHLPHSPPHCSFKEQSENCLLLPSLKPCLLAFPASLLPFGITGDLQSAKPALYHLAAFLALWLGGGGGEADVLYWRVHQTGARRGGSTVWSSLGTDRAHEDMLCQ